MAQYNNGDAILGVIRGYGDMYKNKAVLKQNELDEARRVEAEKRRVRQEKDRVDKFEYDKKQRKVNEDLVSQQLANAKQQNTITQSNFNEVVANRQAVRDLAKANLDGKLQQNATALYAQNKVIEQDSNIRMTDQIVTTDHFNSGDPTTLADPVGFMQEHSELAASMFSRQAAYQFTMIDGEKVDIDVVGFDVTDTSVVPQLVIASGPRAGERVPPTTGATNDPNDDKIAAMNHATAAKLMQNSMVSVISNGGSTSKAFQAKMSSNAALAASNAGEVSAQGLRDKIERQVSLQQMNDPALAREFLVKVGMTDNYDELLELYKTVGGDPAELEAEEEARNGKETASSQTPFGRALNPTGEQYVGRGIGEQMGQLDLRTEGQLDAYNWLKNEISSSDIASKGGKSGYLFASQSDEDYKTNTAAEKFFDNDLNTAHIARVLDGNPNAKKKFAEMGPAKFLATYGTDTEGNPVDAKDIGGTITPPPFKLDIDTIKAAIADESKQATPEQKEQMVEFLTGKDIRSQEDFDAMVAAGKLTEQEAIEAVWVAQAWSTDSNSTAIANNQIDVIKRAGLTPAQAQTVRTNDQKRQALRDDNARKARAKVVAAEVVKADTAAENHTNNFLKLTTDEEGRRISPSQKLNQQLSTSLRTMFANIKNAKSPEAQSTYLNAANQTLGYLLQGEAAKNPSLLGWLWEVVTPGEQEVGAGQPGDFNLNYVRNSDDGDLVYVGPNGVAGEAVSRKDLEAMDVNIYKMLKLAADLNGQEG